MSSASRVSRTEMMAVLGIDDLFLAELEEEEVVLPDAQGYFSPATVERVRVCWTLHHELGVNTPGVEVALQLLERIRIERTRFEEALRRSQRERSMES